MMYLCWGLPTWIEIVVVVRFYKGGEQRTGRGQPAKYEKKDLYDTYIENKPCRRMAICPVSIVQSKPFLVKNEAYLLFTGRTTTSLPALWEKKERKKK